MHSLFGIARGWNPVPFGPKSDTNHYSTEPMFYISSCCTNLVVRPAGCGATLILRCARLSVRCQDGATIAMTAELGVVDRRRSRAHRGRDN